MCYISSITLNSLAYIVSALLKGGFIVTIPCCTHWLSVYYLSFWAFYAFSMTDMWLKWWQENDGKKRRATKVPSWTVQFTVSSLTHKPPSFLISHPCILWQLYNTPIRLLGLNIFISWCFSLPKRLSLPLIKTSFPSATAKSSRKWLKFK